MNFSNIFKMQRRRPRDRSRDIPVLNAAIDVLNVAKDSAGILSIKMVLGSAIALLTLIRVSQDPYLSVLWAVFKQ